MNRHEAWQWIATTYSDNVWDTATPTTRPRAEFVEHGLCHCIAEMWNSSLIDYNTACKLLEDVRTYGPPIGIFKANSWRPHFVEGFRWPPGHREPRKKFAEEMATLAKPEEGEETPGERLKKPQEVGKGEG